MPSHVAFIKRRFLNVGQAWFLEEFVSAEFVGQDVAELIQSRHLPTAAVSVTAFATRTIDLRQDEAALLAALSSTTRYEVRRAQSRDNLACESWSTPDLARLDAFISFYDDFAAQKQLAPASRATLRAYAAAGMLDLSCARSASGQELTWHAYIVAGGRARLLLSASHFRTLDTEARAVVGRANRFHHWDDIARFKKKGIESYDLGGWYEGLEEKEKININAFKQGFGGTLETSHNCVVLLSLKARAYYALRPIIARVRRR